MKDLTKDKGSQPVYNVREEKNVYARMRDGFKLACDIYRPDAEGKFPALLGMWIATSSRSGDKVLVLPVISGGMLMFRSRDYKKTWDMRYMIWD